MSSSTFRILKQCQMCGNMFEAQKVTTRYCSHTCSTKHYKLRAKLERKQKAEAAIPQPQRFRPKAAAITRAMVTDKEFLTVREIAVLFGCSRPTVYNLIKNNRLAATNIGKKKTLVKRSQIDKLFD